MSTFQLVLGALAGLFVGSVYSSTPVATVCGPKTANVTCINRYGSYLPPSFSRDSDPTVAYYGTLVPDDPSWKLVADADFVIFDRERGLELLGKAPKIQHSFFNLLNVIHDAPIFVPSLNKLFITQDGPPGNLTNIVIDLNEDNPTPKSFVTDPPVYQPTGGILHNNMLYWTVQGNNDSLPGGLIQRSGIVRVDPATYEAEWLINNYYGFTFAGLNDLTVDPVGDIWFTDTDYAQGLGFSKATNQIQLASYRFRPSTGEVQIVEDTLNHPNGITFSRDGKTLFITDTGLESVGTVASTGKGGFYNYPIRVNFTPTSKRNIFAFDVTRTPTGAYLTNKRPIFQSLEGSPDGMKVAANGYLVASTGLSPGVDILDQSGSLIARIQAKHAVENIAWSGADFKTLWLSGIGAITKVEFDLAGPDPNNFYTT